MAMDKKAKGALRAEFEGRFEKANAAIVAEYRGLTVAELTELRRELRKVNGEFKVLKNRVAKKAIMSTEKSSALTASLKGPIGVAYLYGDAAAGAKALVEFEKTKEPFKITAGIMEAKFISSAQVKAIADLPSKEVLLGQLVGLLVSPHRGILGVLNAVPRSLVQVINAIKEKKS
jgi:large subunit ribosomal protein L10